MPLLLITIKKVIDFLSRIPAWVWMFIVIVILIILLFQQCNQTKKYKEKYNQNTEALSKAMIIIKNQKGEISSQRAALLVTDKELSDLRDENTDLSNEISRLYEALQAEKKKKEKVKFITLIEGEIINPEIRIKNEIIKADAEGYTSIIFKHKDDFTELEGVSNFKIESPKMVVKYHKVKVGDTWESLAVANNTTVDELKNINQLLNKEPFNGDFNKLPLNKDVGVAYEFVANSYDNVYHTVSQGETLMKIAKLYDVSVDAIKHMNELTSDQISTGDKLIVNRVALVGGETQITKLIQKIDLAVGIREDEEGVKRIFVTPKTPNIKIGNIIGAIIEDENDPTPNPLSDITTKPKRHSIGLQTNFGVGVMQDFNTKTVRFGYGAFIGVGYQYTLFRWGK